MLISSRDTLICHRRAPLCVARGTGLPISCWWSTRGTSEWGSTPGWQTHGSPHCCPCLHPGPWRCGQLLPCHWLSVGKKRVTDIVEVVVFSVLMRISTGPRCTNLTATFVSTVYKQNSGLGIQVYRTGTERGQRSLTPSRSPNSFASRSFSSPLLRVWRSPSLPEYLSKVVMRRPIAVWMLDMMVAASGGHEKQTKRELNSDTLDFFLIFLYWFSLKPSYCEDKDSEFVINILRGMN